MIHPTSIIDKNARISKNAKIGPYTIIGPNVEIDDNVEVCSHVNIEGNTKIGDGTKIFPFASIGSQPQDLKYKGIAKVNGKIMADAQWSATIVDRNK